MLAACSAPTTTMPATAPTAPANGAVLQGATPKDANAATAAPSGTWQGICDNGGPDWGDPMPIELKFQLTGDQLGAKAVVHFESETKEKRLATATLEGTRDVSARWKLHGSMVDANDKTEWALELTVQLDGKRLSGTFTETDNEAALICSFAWTR